MSEKTFEIRVRLPQPLIDKINDLEADQSELRQESVGVDTILRHIIEDFFGEDRPEVTRLKIKNRRNAIAELRNRIKILERSVESLEEQLKQERLDYENAVTVCSENLRDMRQNKQAEIEKQAAEIEGLQSILKNKSATIDFLNWQLECYENRSLWDRIKNTIPNITQYVIGGYENEVKDGSGRETVERDVRKETERSE